MTAFRPSREPPTGEDPFLLPKMMLFVAGAIFGMIGMATERDWILGIALLCLGFGMLLRMIGRRREEDRREAAQRAAEENDGTSPADLP